MYAYAADGLGVSLNHLTGVLKIGVTGSAKLVLAQISNVNRNPIAGAFDFNFEKGEMDILEVPGRHDVCFALRTPVVVEAMTAIALADLVLLK